MKKIILFILLNNLINCSLVSQEYQNFDISPFSEREITRLNIPTILLDTLSVDLLNSFQLMKIPNDLTLKLLKIELVDQPTQLLPSMVTSQDSLKAYDFFFVGKKRYSFSHSIKSYFIVRTQCDDYPLSRGDYPNYHIQVFSLNFVNNELKSIMLIGEEFLSDPYINTSMKTSSYVHENLEYYINTIFYDHYPSGDLSFRTTLILDKKGYVSIKN